MGKNPETSNTQNGESIQMTLKNPHLQSAMKQGRALIDGGGTKADAARAMYALIKSESKEVIVAAFVEGATLTEKGALTYWYNCRRRASKEKKTSGQ